MDKRFIAEKIMTLIISLIGQMEGLIVFIFVVLAVLGIKFFKKTTLFNKKERDFGQENLDKWLKNNKGKKIFNREEAEKKAKEYHKKKGQFQETHTKQEQEEGYMKEEFLVELVKLTGIIFK